MGRRMLAVAELEAISVSDVVIMPVTKSRANGGSVFKLFKPFPSQRDRPDVLEASDMANPAPNIEHNVGNGNESIIVNKRKRDGKIRDP